MTPISIAQLADGHVDLPNGAFRGVDESARGRKPSWIAWRGDREHTRDHAPARRSPSPPWPAPPAATAPARCQSVEGVLRRLRPGEQQRALTEVVEQDRRHHHAEPANPDRAPKWPMSAYNASPPVITRNTAPSAMKATIGCVAMEPAPAPGSAPQAPPARAARAAARAR